MQAKQKNLFEYFEVPQLKKQYGRTTHGGTKTMGRRKEVRPLSPKKWIHLVLKSDKAKGNYSFLSIKNKMMIEELVYEKALKFGVRIADFANVGNHLHMKIKIHDRKSFQKFLKAITCLIARKITRAARGKKFGRFWQGLAFTRVLTSSREELNLRGYIRANTIEATHSYHAREKFLKGFQKWAKTLQQEYHLVEPAPELSG